MNFILAIILGTAFAQSKPIEIKVLVIDTGIASHEKLKDYVQYDGSDDYKDTHGHGTHVAGIVAFGNKELNDPLCKNVKIYSCKYYSPGNAKSNVAKTSNCFDRATREGMDYVNYSSSGIQYSNMEYDAIKTYTSLGGIVVTAAGNEHGDLSERPVFPAKYAFGFTEETIIPKLKLKKVTYFRPLRNMYVVANECNDGKLCKSSSYHPLVLRANGQNIKSTYLNNEYSLMTGTSQATPAVLHTILKQRCEEIKYKTSSQLTKIK